MSCFSLFLVWPKNRGTGRKTKQKTRNLKGKFTLKEIVVGIDRD